MTRTCKKQYEAAKAAKSYNTSEAEGGWRRAAEAASGMNAHDVHAQVLHATSNGDRTAPMRGREPLRYPLLRGQPGVPAQAQNATTQ